MDKNNFIDGTKFSVFIRDSILIDGPMLVGVYATLEEAEDRQKQFPIAFIVPNIPAERKL